MDEELKSSIDRDRDLVATAAALRDALWNDAAQSDRDRRLTDETVASITGAGLTRLMTPERFGGHEASVRTLLDVCVELGRGSCSASWVTGVLNAGNLVVSLFGDRAQAEVWGSNPDARSALVLGAPVRTVEPVDGGVVVSGEWPYASGSLHADWVGVLILLSNGVHFALLPASEISVKDTWFFTGMRGTGSNTVVADRLFVPEHRLLPYGPVLAGETDGLVDPSHRYRNSLTGLFSIGLIGSLVGGAQAAFDLVRDKAPSRRVAGSTYANQAESPTAQLDLAEASVKVRTATMHARELADTVDHYAGIGENADIETRARARMLSTFVARQSREAVDLLVTTYGSSAFDESSPLGRIWRDVHVGSRHAGFGMGIPEQLYGRVLVGKDPREISVLV